MVNKCPNCGFEPIGDKLVCPECGFEIKENIAKKIKDDHLEGMDHIEEIEQTDNNDNIKWSDYKDVSIGSMMEQLEEQTSTDDPKEDTPSAEEESNILAAYIREHQVENSSKESESVEESTETAEDIPAEALDSEQKPSAVEEVLEEDEVIEEPIAASGEEIQEIEKTIPVMEQSEEIKQPAPPLSEEVKTADQKELVRKSKKGLYWTAACTLLVIGAGGGWLYHTHQQEEARQAQVVKTQKALTQLAADLDGFYLSDQHQFIKPGKTLADLTAIQEKLKNYQKEADYQSLSKEAATIEEKLNILAKINGFFEAPIVVGDELKEVYLKDGQPINMAKLSGDSAFSKLINQAIEKGQKEFAQIEEVRNAVKSTTAQYKEGQLAESVTQSSYQNLMKQVMALPNGKIRATLIEDLKPIEAALMKREQVLAEAQAQAAQEAHQAQEAQEAESSVASESNVITQEPAVQDTGNGSYILAPNTPSQPDNQPIIPSRASDIADTSNPAWIWNPGVKEKIIQTAIDRGYVVEGGYMFKPVRIENGEGYYNFYATNTKSNLMKDISESALPFYLFTVNDKTGYFRGNGNDHTIR